MTIYNEVTELIYALFIKSIFISVLVVMLAYKLLKNWVDVPYSINIIKWMMLVYSVFIFVADVILLFFAKVSYIDSLYFRRQFTGPYWYVDLFLTLSQVLPLVLFSKKLARSIYFVLFFSILMNIRWLMESLVIHIMSIHRDYAYETNPFLPFDSELLALLKGLFWGGITVLIGAWVKFRKAHHVSQDL